MKIFCLLTMLLFSHLYIVGFWSLGFKPIVIDEIILE